MNKNIACFIETYQKLNKNNLELLERLYSNDIHFEDPLHSIKGMRSLKTYFASMYENVEFCHFDFKDIIEDTKQDFEPELNLKHASLTWVMSLKHKSLGNKTIEVEGITHIKFAEKVVYHKDYFDLGKMLYQNIPLLGRCIKLINARAVQ